MSKPGMTKIKVSEEAFNHIQCQRDEKNHGFIEQDKVLTELLHELIRDPQMGGDNRKYMAYLVDVIELTRLLMIK